MNNIVNGHRARLLNRYDNGGIKSLHDYEILELVLTFVIARRDTKPIARNLLKKYQNISSILSADKKGLLAVDGIGEKSALFLTLFHEVAGFALREKFTKEKILSCRQDVEEYLRFHFGMRSDEYLAVVYLDNSNRVIATEELSKGTINRCAVYPRELFSAAINRGAAGIIIAHNHPGGSVTPSVSDWTLTTEILNAGKILDVNLLDHIIITGKKTVSLRELPSWPK